MLPAWPKIFTYNGAVGPHASGMFTFIRDIVFGPSIPVISVDKLITLTLVLSADFDAVKSMRGSRLYVKMKGAK